MDIKRYEHYDNNILEINTRVLDVKEENGSFLVLLEDSPFRASSGGQPCDKGMLIQNNRKFQVKEVVEKDNNLWHVLSERISSGPVLAVVDSEYRKRMSMLHSAEHLFFGSLKKINEDAKVIKIDLSSKPKLFISGNISNENLFKAEVLTNRIIDAGVDRIVHYRNKDNLNDLIEKGLRIRTDRIKDDVVRIIEFKDYDISACSGTHVKNSSEIKHFIIDDFKKEKGQTVVFFEVGSEAIKMRLQRSQELLKISKMLNTSTDDTERKVKSCVEKNSELKEKYHYYLTKFIEKSNPEKIGEINLYTFEFKNEESKVLTRAIKPLCKGKNSVVLILNKHENSLEVIICSNIINCKLLADEILKLGGRGGGSERLCICSLNRESKEILDIVKQKILKGI